jgi:dimethylamine monooxygenase subunit A
MGTARTNEGLTPLGDPSAKQRLLTEHRDEVLAATNLELLGPLERAAVRVEEDLCVLVDGVLVAGCVCFPSHWQLKDKIGRHLTDVHARVPGYDAELASKVDSFLRRLTPHTVVGRRNFTIHERPDLYAPVVPPPMEVPPAEQWLRSERQTLRRLPRSEAVLFTIRTQQVQLQHIDEVTRRRLAARLRAEPADLIAYRNLTDRLPALVAWLSP